MSFPYTYGKNVSSGVWKIVAIESVSRVLVTLDVFRVVAGQSPVRAGCTPAWEQNFGVCPAMPFDGAGAAVHNTVETLYNVWKVAPLKSENG